MKGTPEYAPDVVADICEYLVENDTTLYEICRKKLVPDAPSVTTLLFWAQCDERIKEILHEVRAAKAAMLWAGVEQRVEEIFDEAVENGTKSDIMAAAQKAKLIVDIRKFEVSKLVRGIYGDSKETADQLNSKAERTLQERIEKMKQDGVVVETKVVEIPPMEDAGG